MNYYPLFRVRSWNNGLRCMSLYIVILDTIAVALYYVKHFSSAQSDIISIPLLLLSLLLSLLLMFMFVIFVVIIYVLLLFVFAVFLLIVISDIHSHHCYHHRHHHHNQTHDTVLICIFVAYLVLATPGNADFVDPNNEILTNYHRTFYENPLPRQNIDSGNTDVKDLSRDYSGMPDFEDGVRYQALCRADASVKANQTVSMGSIWAFFAI